SRLSVANASHHLRLLRDAGLVVGRRDGVFVHYALAGDDVLELWLSMRAVAADRVAEVERAARAYLGGGVGGIGRGGRAGRRRGRATGWWWTPGPPWSSRRATSGAPARSLSTSSSAAWKSCRRTPRSWPTAVGRIACTPTRRCVSSAAPAGGLAASRT